MRDFIDVEKNMALRRKQVQSILRKDEIVLSMSIFPTLGVNPFTTPETWPDPETSFTRSQFWPSEGTYQGHPRFKTLTTNIRQRRGRKVFFLPIFFFSTLKKTFLSRLS